MYRWNPSDADFSAMDLDSPKYGLSYDKNAVSRINHSEFFSPFQPCLIDHKNETADIEYNPIDVLNYALKFQVVNTKPPKQSKQQAQKNSDSNLGYLLFAHEMFEAVQAENPHAQFDDVSKVAREKWMEMSSEEQEVFIRRSKSLPEMQEDEDSNSQKNFYL